MTERADVVIVGGGAMGASTAFHLAEMGITDVVIVEREVLAAGSTSKAAGGVRLQFADEVNVRIMLRSVPEFERFDERFDADIGFQQVGYLFLLSTPKDLETFRAGLEVQQRLGVPSRELTVDEAREIVPQIKPDGLLGAAFCPRDGHATPEAVVQGYAGAAAARGVRIRQHCEATGIELDGGRIAAVHTTKGTIHTDTVVCAAGVGSAAVGRLAGVEIPVTAEPHWVHYSPGDCGLPTTVPMTIDFATGFYLHREGPGLVFGSRDASLDAVAAAGTARFPVLADLRVQTSWWGDYELSPDRNGIVGEAAEPSRFLYATGFSGHGFQQCPAIGEHLAERIAGRRPTLDLSTFALERFGDGTARAEAFVV